MPTQPFSESTTIHYELATEAPVTLEVFDLSGKKVATLFEQVTLSAGMHEASLSAKGLAAGMYVCQLTVGGRSRMIFR